MAHFFLLFLACSTSPDSETPESQGEIQDSGGNPGYLLPSPIEGWGCVDGDRDGWGVAPCGFGEEYRPVVGFGDCDDENRDINPDQAEVCDGRDNDCDEVVDDEVGTWAYPDQDHDGCPDEGAEGQYRCPEGMSGFSTGC